MLLQACRRLSVSGEDAYRSVLRLLRSRLVRLPKIDPAPEESPPSRELVRLFAAATKEQKKSGAAYLGVDVLLRLVVDHVRSKQAQIMTAISP
jgi:ATP-dependent Clp protease ATP-binding subunit ClpB